MNTPVTEPLSALHLEANENTAEPSAMLAVVQQSAAPALASRRNIVGAGLGSIGSVALPTGLGAWLATQPEQTEAKAPWVVLPTCIDSKTTASAPLANTTVWQSAEMSELEKNCKHTSKISYKAIYRTDNQTFLIGETSYYKNPVNKGDEKQTKPVFVQHCKITKNPKSRTLTIYGASNQLIHTVTVDSLNNSTTYWDKNSISSNDKPPNDPWGDEFRRRTTSDPTTNPLNQNQINQYAIEQLTTIFFDRLNAFRATLLNQSSSRMKTWLRIMLAPNFEKSGLTRHMIRLEPLSNTGTFGIRFLVRYVGMPAHHYFSMTMVRVFRLGVQSHQYTVALAHIEANPVGAANVVYHNEFRQSGSRNDPNVESIDDTFWVYKYALDSLLSLTAVYHTSLFGVISQVTRLMQQPQVQQNLVRHRDYQRALVSFLSGVYSYYIEEAQALNFPTIGAIQDTMAVFSSAAYQMPITKLVVAAFTAMSFADQAGDNVATFVLNLYDADPNHRRLIGYTHDRKNLLTILNPDGSCRLCSKPVIKPEVSPLSSRRR